MIVDRKIKVKITKKNISHYIKFYPEVSIKDIIYVDVENELMKGSNQKLNVMCDICGNERYISFQMYNRNLNSCPGYLIYTCDKCSHIKIKESNKKKYGTEYYSQTKEYSERFKNTMIEKYGVEYPLQNKDLKEKQQNNNLQKYGVKNVLQSDLIKNKIKKINLEKYGVENIQSLPEIRKKIEKTMLERYGVKSPFENKSPFRELAKNTMLERYGVDIYSKNNDFIDKVKKTNLEKYGVEWVMKSDIFKNKSKESIGNKYGVNNISKSESHREKFKISNHVDYIKYIGDSISLFRCSNGHDFEIHFTIFNNRNKNNTPLCTICNPIGESSSIKENEVYKFILDNYNNDSIKSYRDKYEIDIYLPDLKLGFEFNGLYWHSELYKEKNYHHDKKKYFKDRGINIINIWEDDWDHKSDIIKSMILNKIGKCNLKIGARKCEIKEISNKECKNFLNSNHVQGWCISKYRYGLFFNGDMVCVMTFGSLRKNLGQTHQENKYELLRFCNKLGTNVVGGASKLFKHFITSVNPVEILSFSKNDYSNGNLYRKLGFTDYGYTGTNYYWVVNNIRENRYKWRKDILVKMGEDKSLSESKIMKSKGYYRIYDSGNIKWIYKK